MVLLSKDKGVFQFSIKFNNNYTNQTSNFIPCANGSVFP